MSIVGYNVSHEGLIPQLKQKYQNCELTNDEICQALFESKNAQLKILGSNDISMDSVQNEVRDAIHRAYQTTRDDLLFLSSRLKPFSSYMYGGVVRDFFVLGCDAKDVDIWFANKESMELFLKNQRFMTLNKHEFVSGKIDDYPFERHQYAVKFNRSGHSYILDCIVSAEFPVNDFDVNNLILKGRAVRHVNSLKYKNPTKEQKQALIAECKALCDQIMKKEMTMLDTYLPFLGKTSAIYRVIKFTKVREWTITNLPEGFVDSYDYKAGLYRLNSIGRGEKLIKINQHTIQVLVNESRR